MPRVLTVSESSAGDIAAQMGVRRDRMSVVPVGVDTGLFRPLPHVARVPGPADDHGQRRRPPEGPRAPAGGAGQGPHRAPRRARGRRPAPRRQPGARPPSSGWAWRARSPSPASSTTCAWSSCTPRPRWRWCRRCTRASRCRRWRPWPAACRWWPPPAAPCPRWSGADGETAPARAARRPGRAGRRHRAGPRRRRPAGPPGRRRPGAGARAVHLAGDGRGHRRAVPARSSTPGCADRSTSARLGCRPRRPRCSTSAAAAGATPSRPTAGAPTWWPSTATAGETKDAAGHARRPCGWPARRRPAPSGRRSTATPSACRSPTAPSTG